MTILKGIDVSIHQGKIDWTKVKGNVDFAILRAGYGDAITYPGQKDSTFAANYNGCKANGIPCGVYWYSYAMSAEAAKREAQACLSMIKGKKFEYPIFFDLEEQKQFAKGKAFCDSIVKAFCTEIEKAGYFAGLYMSRYPLQAYISPSVANKYALWVAEYGSKCNYNGDNGMWQYSDMGRVNGISGYVDVNYCYVNYPAKIKNAELNGYTKPKPATVVMKSKYTRTKKAIRINWHKVKGTSGYRVYRYNVKTKKWDTLKTISNANTTTYRDGNTLLANTEYKYKVKAYIRVDGTPVWGEASKVFKAKTKK